MIEHRKRCSQAGFRSVSKLPKGIEFSYILHRYIYRKGIESGNAYQAMSYISWNIEQYCDFLSASLDKEALPKDTVELQWLEH